MIAHLCWSRHKDICRLKVALGPCEVYQSGITTTSCMGVQADRGTVFLEMQYHPFKAAGKAAAAKEPGAQKANMTLGMSKKSLTQDHKGVLTITLIRCIDLEVLVCPFDARVNITSICPCEHGVLCTLHLQTLQPMCRSTHNSS